jgi:predicted oxidoreductase
VSVPTYRNQEILTIVRDTYKRFQAWSPFQYGFFEGVFLNNEQFPELNKAMDAVAEKPSRIKEIGQISKFQLTRPEWYELYRAAGNILP